MVVYQQRCGVANSGVRLSGDAPSKMGIGSFVRAGVDCLRVLSRKERQQKPDVRVVNPGTSWDYVKL